MSSYRLDYASASPRTFCTNCGLVIRSGDIRFTAWNTYRHLDCVTNLEVLKLWQHCRNFENVPGFSSLESADRYQVQQLFKTLLLSTPVQAQGMMRAKIIAAAAAAGAMHQPMSTGSPTSSPPLQPRPFRNNNEPMATGSPTPSMSLGPTAYENQLRREPSNDVAMMLTDSTSPPSANEDASFGMSFSPDIISPSTSSLALSHDMSSSSSHTLPLGAPALSATPSALASYMSNLSCSTPTHAQHGNSPTPFLTVPQPASHNPHQPLSHSSPSLAHRPLANFRPRSGSSSSSPGVGPRNTDRSVSPFSAPGGLGGWSQHPTMGSGSGFGAAQQQQQQQQSAFLSHQPSSLPYSHPASPHSSHSHGNSPVPFGSTMHLPIPQQQAHAQQQSHLLPQQPLATRVPKRKLEQDSIPEEELLHADGFIEHQQQLQPVPDPDAMMDGVEEDDPLRGHVQKKRMFVKPVR